MLPIEARNSVSFSPTIPAGLYPFHPDSQNRLPGFVTNGSVGKAQFVKEWLPLIGTPEVKAATGRAEDMYHEIYGDGIMGPYDLDGVPYPLCLAFVKLGAAAEVLGQESGSLLTQDTVYRVRIPEHGVDVTVHKPKNPMDRQRLVRFFHEAAQAGNARLSSVGGVARCDVYTGVTEGFCTETQLGILIPHDTGTLDNRMIHNPGISAGTSTYELPGFLVKPHQVLETTVQRWGNGQGSPEFGGGSLHLNGSTAVKALIEDPGTFQQFGLGFIPR